MGEKIPYGIKFTYRPIKSAGKRRQRIKVQKKRLLAAGMDPGVIRRMTTKDIREALKQVACKRGRKKPKSG